jgi:hypothetical protein
MRFLSFLLFFPAGNPFRYLTFLQPQQQAAAMGGTIKPF